MHIPLKSAAIAAVALAGVTTAAQEPDLVARARAIHERVITLDTHNDVEPGNFTRACNYTMPLTTQVNLPKMKAGGLTFNSPDTKPFRTRCASRASIPT